MSEVVSLGRVTEAHAECAARQAGLFMQKTADEGFYMLVTGPRGWNRRLGPNFVLHDRCTLGGVVAFCRGPARLVHD